MHTCIFVVVKQTVPEAVVYITRSPHIAYCMQQWHNPNIAHLVLSTTIELKKYIQRLHSTVPASSGRF